MINDYPLMKCGHTANAESNGKPCCVICDCFEIADTKPNLEGRKARCTYCNKMTDSSYNLPFFEYQANKTYDEYYCGCRGWD